MLSIAFLCLGDGARNGHVFVVAAASTTQCAECLASGGNRAGLLESLLFGLGCNANQAVSTTINGLG